MPSQKKKPETTKKTKPTAASKPVKAQKPAKAAKPVKAAKAVAAKSGAAKTSATKTSPVVAATPVMQRATARVTHSVANPTADQIRARAHQIWVQGGRKVGNAQADWSRAEAELRGERNKS